MARFVGLNTVSFRQLRIRTGFVDFFEAMINVGVKLLSVAVGGAWKRWETRAANEDCLATAFDCLGLFGTR